jgi:hypothetical protein
VKIRRVNHNSPNGVSEKKLYYFLYLQTILNQVGLVDVHKFYLVMASFVKIGAVKFTSFFTYKRKQTCIRTFHVYFPTRHWHTVLVNCISSMKIATRCPYIVMGILHAITSTHVHMYNGRAVDNTPLSSAEVKERVKLYICPLIWTFLACSRVNIIVN